MWEVAVLVLFGAITVGLSLVVAVVSKRLKKTIAQATASELSAARIDRASKKSSPPPDLEKTLNGGGAENRTRVRKS